MSRLVSVIMFMKYHFPGTSLSLLMDVIPSRVHFIEQMIFWNGQLSNQKQRDFCPRAVSTLQSQRIGGGDIQWELTFVSIKSRWKCAQHKICKKKMGSRNFREKRLPLPVIENGTRKKQKLQVKSFALVIWHSIRFSLLGVFFFILRATCLLNHAKWWFLLRSIFYREKVAVLKLVGWLGNSGTQFVGFRERMATASWCEYCWILFGQLLRREYVCTNGNCW